MILRNTLYIFLFLIIGAVSTVSIAETDREVVMFSIDYCPSCEAAKRFFNEHGIVYSEYNLNESAKARTTFERLGGRGTPLLFLEGKTMNGFHPQRFRQFWRKATGEDLETK
ncbi:glutaredoxin family protein [Halospina sp. K52047b]|uniref:glutaredoxin family protein n=1 Tax=Halospina sp. K52047b TaxID=2614160 RepID=UPI001787DC6F|nr:glutaredoxin family protein [Halospina sp. K52047b]